MNAAQALVDMPLWLRAILDDYADNQGLGSSNITAASGVAQVYAIMHDRAASERYILQSAPDAPETLFYRSTDEVVLALQSGDVPDAHPLTEHARTMWKLWQHNPGLQVGDDSLCFAGYVFGLNGDAAKADAVFQRMNLYSRCDAFRGALKERAGSFAAAEAVWVEGIAKSPDLPFVYMTRGQSRMKRGDLAGAEADFEAAHHGTPHFADPLKLWGDLLFKEGKTNEALAKYDEALQYAPNWQELRQARANAKRS